MEGCAGLARMFCAMRLVAVVAPVLGLCVGVAGCARTLPPEPSAAALYRDLERLVSLQAASGWRIDRTEVEAVLPSALMSVCRVEPARRALLRRWLDARIDALGGPVEQAYRDRGRSLERVEDLLALTRVRMVLDRAVAAADADCPFWLEPVPEFRGRQISDDRWQFSGGGGGKLIAVSQGSRQDMEFGGGGRLMLGRSIGSRLGVYTGFALGGSASIPPDDNGERTNLVLAMDFSVPAVLRFRLINTYFEVEGGYLVRATDEDWSRIEHGMHLGVGFGGRASRVRWFFPGAVLSVVYERTFPDDHPDLHMLKIGVRATADFDL